MKEGIDSFYRGNIGKIWGQLFDGRFQSRNCSDREKFMEEQFDDDYYEFMDCSSSCIEQNHFVTIKNTSCKIKAKLKANKIQID